jgi:Na+-transporting methylmalonyl-CoA/oxaloacetate decarboxylase gamma subunit
MFLVANQAMEDLSIGTAGIIALLGYAVVFMGLIALMVVVIIMGKLMVSSQKRKADKAAAKAAAAPAAPVAEAAPAAQVPAAPGTAGEIKLYNVSDRDAAMVMAVVAYKLQKPLNELRFKSIQEVQ